ncbi:MAG: ketoacyl reductase [Labilithrix sp.]|nr:ketoacyl reductase [Labilithrix sp.]
MDIGRSHVVTSLAVLAGGAWLVRRLRRYSLEGKNALVTGGGRGLGLEIARKLVARGAHVAVVAQNEIELAKAVDQLQALAGARGTRVIGVPCNLDDKLSIDEMLSAVRMRLGPVDVLVNNAGVIQVGPLDTMSERDFEHAMRVHYHAPLRTMLGVRAEMKARGGGRIANVSSVGGVVAVPHLLPYSGSKFALIGLSQGMHAELAQDGIVVSTIAPGLMRTGSPRNAVFKGDHRKEHAWFTISDSLPGISMSAERAAARIVSAIEHGDAHVVLGAPAKLAALAHGLAPGLVARMMAVVNAALPHGTDPTSRFGHESESPLAPSILTTLTDAAAARNNEL